MANTMDTVAVSTDIGSIIFTSHVYVSRVIIMTF